MSQIKRFILIVFLLCLVDDICIFIEYLGIRGLSITNFYLIFDVLSDGTHIVSLSIVFLLLTSVITFLTFFFSKDNND